MIIKTKEFKDIANKILLATEVDKTGAANLEIVAKDTSLFLNVTNREYYVSTKFPIDPTVETHATVDASLFLSLISGIYTETFELSLDQNSLLVKAGKSKYKLPLISDGDGMLTLPVIRLNEADKDVEMKISNDILSSILNVNSKELLKVKKVDVDELQKLYYIDETGCFTFTSGACLNTFQLEKPIKLLLNDRIVKLFKLFNEDVLFKFGHEALPDQTLQTKITLETENIYLAAIITCDDILLNKIQGPCSATKNFANEAYSNHLVLSVNELSAAISRLMLFTKNSIDKANMTFVPATVTFNQTEIVITDNQENKEVVTIENDSTVEVGYSMGVNLFDLKLILDSCKTDHITLDCGNHRSIIISRGPVINLVPEVINN